MRARVALFSISLLALAACGGATDATGINGDVAPADVQIDITTVATTPDGPIVPDFTMTLADGSTFDLAEIDTPLYVMFWAEW